MTIPLVDLQAQYTAIKAEIDHAIRSVVEDAAFIGGSTVAEFERDFAVQQGAESCVGVGNGTDAIFIALKMLGIGAGDEVITTAHSWISTSEAISATGATPVFVDVDQYYGLDPDRIVARLTARTKAILPVHLYGQAADMTRVMQIAEEHGLLVVEDCAQAHHATWRGTPVGTFGSAGTFSFYPGKNLGAYGDAGAIVMNDPDLEARIRMYANHGQVTKHDHRMEGVNSRLDGIQAAILRAKLPHLADWTNRRRTVALWYDELLADFPAVATPNVRPGAAHVYHLYVIQVHDRDGLAAHLAGKRIQTGIHYPSILPLLDPYADNDSARDAFPLAAKNQDRILSLPMYPELTRGHVEQIAAVIGEWCASHEPAPSP